MLVKEQRIGALILFVIALAAWLFVAIHRSHSSLPSGAPEPAPAKRTWEQRKDSMRHADSVRYALWAAEREQRYDSFRLADSLRRAEWKRIRQQQYDSFRLADSLWRDSVGWKRTRRVKKDTILNLNRCDTTELLLIRGIGSYAARQIIRYREQLGGFYSPSQLADEPLANIHLDTLQHHFFVQPSDVQIIPINDCSISRLQRHPYLRYNQAKAIYNLRRQRIHLHSIDELRDLPEFTDDDLLRLSPYLSFE